MRIEMGKRIADSTVKNHKLWREEIKREKDKNGCGDSTSGTFKVSAPTIENFSSSSISGPVSLDLEEAPKALDIQTTSGNIDLILHENAAFTLDYDATSGELSSDLPYIMESGRNIFGDGTGEYGIGAISGDVRIAVSK